MFDRLGWGLVLFVAGATLLPACSRKPAEVNPIEPSLKVNRDARAPRQRASR